jgi:hypothetical protein
MTATPTRRMSLCGAKSSKGSEAASTKAPDDYAEKLRRASKETHFSDDGVSNDDTFDECQTEADIIEVHLETMNLAAEEMNTAQNELTEMRRRRLYRLESWDIASARFAEAAPGVQIAKAAVYFDCKRQCEKAHYAVEAASVTFLRAMEDGAPKNIIEELSTIHVQSIAHYKSLQRSASEVRRSTGLSEAAMKAALPYYDAKALHLEEMAKMDTELQLVEERVGDARALYQAALQGLESISENEHRRRAAATTNQ